MLGHSEEWLSRQTPLTLAQPAASLTMIRRHRLSLLAVPRVAVAPVADLRVAAVEVGALQRREWAREKAEGWRAIFSDLSER